jgi:hypothetical protein
VRRRSGDVRVGVGLGLKRLSFPEEDVEMEREGAEE